MARYGVINRVLPDAELMAEGMAFAAKAAAGPTLAHSAHKALLRTWSSGGKAVADQGLMDIAMPLFESADARTAIPAAVDAMQRGDRRPQFNFKGK
jgi:enoyl-CoA hydratase/carnithine racemase